MKEKELQGMPDKTESQKLAEEILAMKETIKLERERLNSLKNKFIDEMRSQKKSLLLVHGFEFEVEFFDKLNIRKKK